MASTNGNESTADFVRNSRIRLNLTQEELAETLGFERRSIMRFERGAFLPTYVRLALECLLMKQQQKKQRAKERAAHKQKERSEQSRQSPS